MRPRLRILLDSGSQWSQVTSAIPVEDSTGMDPTSTVAASEGAIARNLVEFRGHEQATRVDSESGSVRSEPHVQGGSDTESIAGISEHADGVELVDAIDFAPRATHSVFGGSRLFGRSESSVPFCLQGAFRGAMKVSLQAVCRGYEQHSDLHVTRGWKLFMLFPRLLLFRQSPEENIGRTIPHVSGRKMVGIGSLEQEHRGQCTSVICQTPPSPEAG